MNRLLLAALLACAACGSEQRVDPESGAGGGGGGTSQPTVQTLGVNDVSMLVPMPATATIVLLRASETGADGTELVPRALFDRLNEAPVPDEPLIGPVVGDLYADLQVVAIRFDLCDRLAPGPCPDSDGRLRVVFQALMPTSPVMAADVAFHAFYTIPKADFPVLVAELRALAKIQNADLGAPLQVSPALAASTSGEYATRLTALVKKYAGSETLQRLTFFAQPQTFAQVRWIFRGIEKRGDAFVDIAIPGIDQPVQHVITEGVTGFEVRPIADQPPGFALVVSDMDFGAAARASQEQALGALAASDNPLAHTPETLQCATCHVSTLLMAERAAAIDMDPLSVSDRYTALGYDLSVPPPSDRTLRALGWLQGDPLIAQRAANESAQVAIEMDSRF